MNYEDYVYDIETYKNLFSVVIGCTKTRKCWTFEFSERKNDIPKLMQMIKWLRKKGNARMVGFNNLGFDYPIIHFVAKNSWVTVEDIYDKAQEIIGGFGSEDRFKHQIQEANHLVKQVDLFKIHHFDNKAKATSLKMIEFNMRSDDIQDLPYNPHNPLTHAQMDKVLAYNKHDVLQTYLFYIESLPAINFRELLSEKYGRDFTNANDTKIGKDYFIMRLEENDPECCYQNVGGRRKMRQTKRKSIAFKDVIFDYVKFERPEFQAVLNWFKQKVITETKGSLTEILEHDLGEELAKYCVMVKKSKKLKDKPTDDEIAEMKKEIPLLWIEERQLKSGKTVYYKCWNLAENLNVVVDGFRYDFGTGGIHGSVDSTVIRSENGKTIRDSDVASYYPNLAIVNRVYPKHLGEEFCDIYQDVYLERKSYPKGTPENAVMKLALNGTYGASNDQYSPFFDPKFTMAITINGQLSLCMLAEQLIKIDGLEMVQVNTDGLTVTCPNESLDDHQRICDEWENLTKLELEHNDYSMMAIRDVNNYLAVYSESGKVKRNGAYEYDGLGYHQNQSSLVIKKAAEHALVNNGDISEFIIGHKDRMDFMLRTKVPRSSRLTLRYFDDNGEVLREEEQQNITRYYIAKNGGKLIKIMPPLEGKETEREIGIDKSWLVKTCNRISDYDGDINYDYYIHEAEKLVKPLLRND